MPEYNDSFNMNIILTNSRRLAKKFVYYVWWDKIKYLQIHFIWNDPYDCFEWRNHFISAQDCWITLTENLKPKAVKAYLEYVDLAQWEAKYGIKAFCNHYNHYDVKSFCMEYHQELLTDKELNT